MNLVYGFTKKNMKLLLLLLIITVLLNACTSPYSITRLTPVENNSYWVNGSEKIYFQSDTLSITLSYSQNTRDELHFDLKADYRGINTLLIDPRLFFIEFIGESNLGWPYAQATDPEVKLLNTEKQIARNSARSSNTAFLHLTEMLVNTAADVSDLNKSPSEEERYEKEQCREYARDRRQNEIDDIDIERQNLNQMLDYYATEMLRKTTLFPNTWVGGVVIFPRNEKANRYKINLPVGGDTLSFVYHQKIVSSNNY